MASYSWSLIALMAPLARIVLGPIQNTYDWTDTEVKSLRVITQNLIDDFRKYLFWVK